MRKSVLSILTAASIGAAVGMAHADTITNIVYTTAANTSGGGVTLTIDNQGTPNDGNGHTLPGYTAFELTLTANNGANGWVNGVIDFGGVQNDPSSGFSGPLVVESTVSTHLGQTVTTPILNDAGTTDNPTAGTYYSALGSHFLDDQAVNVAAGPDAFGSISGTITPTPNSDGGYSLGLTHSMLGATGFYLQNQKAVQPWAYLVIPNGDSVTFTAQDALIQKTAGSNPPQDLIDLSGTIATPEPASLGLFAVGAAGLLLLHRRRQKLS